jgi:hypothetical protein
MVGLIRESSQEPDGLPPSLSIRVNPTGNPPALLGDKQSLTVPGMD